MPTVAKCKHCGCDVPPYWTTCKECFEFSLGLDALHREDLQKFQRPGVSTGLLYTLGALAGTAFVVILIWRFA